MQNKKTKTSEAIQSLSRVFKFELWLRFYFIQDNEDKLSINLDDQMLEKLEKEYGHLSKLAGSMNHKEINPEICRKAITDHIMNEFDGSVYEIGLVPRILDNRIFKTEIQLFNTWVSLHEDQLDRKVLDFDKWLEIFDEWKKSESAQKIGLTLDAQSVMPKHPGSQKDN